MGLLTDMIINKYKNFKIAMLLFCLLLALLHFFVQQKPQSHIMFESLLLLIVFFRLWILIIIKKLSCFQKQEKIINKEKNNLKILNIFIIRYFGSGLVVIFGGFLTERKVDSFLILRVFSIVYVIALFILFFVKDKTKERLLSLQNKNIQQDFRKVLQGLMNAKSIKFLCVGFFLFIVPEYGLSAFSKYY